MKNASVRGWGGGGWHLREVWIWWVSRARQNLSISPPISDRMFLRARIMLFQYYNILRNCRHFSCILCTTKIHTMLSFKKIYVFQSRKGNLFELPIVEYILVYYVTNIVNYFVLFFNVLDLYIFLLHDIDVIT